MCMEKPLVEIPGRYLCWVGQGLWEYQSGPTMLARLLETQTWCPAVCASFLGRGLNRGVMVSAITYVPGVSCSEASQFISSLCVPGTFQAAAPALELKWAHQ